MIKLLTILLICFLFCCCGSYKTIYKKKRGDQLVLTDSMRVKVWHKGVDYGLVASQDSGELVLFGSADLSIVGEHVTYIMKSEIKKVAERKGLSIVKTTIAALAVILPIAFALLNIL